MCHLNEYFGRAAWLLVAMVAGSVTTGHAASPSCAEKGAIPTDLQATSLVATLVTGAISIPEQYRETLRVQNAFVLTGSCRADVAGFITSYILFKNELRVSMNERDGLSPAEASPAFSYSTDFDGEPPPWNKGSFVMARRVDTRRSKGGVTECFVGLWRDSERSTVGVFSRRPNKAVSKPALLFTSELPIRSVTYFPAIDTPAGSLGVTQEAGEELRMINLDWYHSKLPD